jgi:hypothetical protein
MADFYLEYDTASHVLAVRVIGAFTDAAMRACYDALADAITSRDVRAAVLDLTAAQEFNLSADAVRGMSKLAPLLPDPLPKYIVASKAHVYGMARMFQITSRGRDALQVVRSPQDAYASLGLNTPNFERLDTR